VAVAGARTPALAQSQDSGTTARQLSDTPLLFPPAKVLVLPLFTRSGDDFQQKLATASVWQLLKHEGLTMVPLPDAFSSWTADTLHESGVAPRIGDALRVGKAAGADWVVWGQVTAPEQAGRAWGLAGEIFFARTDSGQIFFARTHVERETRLPEDLQYQGYALARRLLFDWSQHSLELLISALPAHNTDGPDPSEDTLRGVVANAWPDSNGQ